MLKTVKALLIILFISTFSLQVSSETSWITKKDKTKKTLVKKTETESKKNEWIKKKKKEEVKKNKEKFKEKIKESKSWITKKSKEKIKDIKENLKKYKDIDSLPKAGFYYAAIVEPKENEEPTYLYGYVNSDTKSKKFELNNMSYYSKSDGIGFLDDGKTTCQVDSQIGAFFGDMMGKVVVKCKNNLEMTGTFKQTNNKGKGIEGETNKGNNVEFEFYTSKNDAIAKLELYKEVKETLITRSLPAPRNNKNIKLEPNGKYYALLIGNSEYDNWDNLVSPTNDINKIKQVFDKSYKFEKIITVKNGSKKQIFKAFRELSQLTTTNDFVFIYYSGHGEIKAEQAYWIPTDGSKKWGNGDWINIMELDIYLREIKAHHLTLMVDSCYVGGKFKGLNLLDNMTDEDTQIFENVLKENLESRARSVLSSGSTGPVSDTVAGTNHSRFALVFLNILNDFSKKNIPVNLSNIAMNMKVSFLGTRQKPHYYHPSTWENGGGDFVFIPKKNLK